MTPDRAAEPAVLSARDVRVILPGERGRTLRHRRPQRGLEGLTVDLHRGQAIHLIGGRLSGVVEALEVLSGRRVPDAGHLLIDGDEVPVDRRSRSGWHDRVAVLEAPVMPGSRRRTVLEWLAEQVRTTDPETPSGADSHHARAISILDQVGVEEAERTSRVRDVPAALDDRLALARLLALGPKVVVVGLAWQPQGADEALCEAVLADLRAAGTAIVRASESLPTAMAADERALVMCGGHLVEVLDGPGLGHPLHPWTRALAAGAEPIGERPEPDDPGCPFRGPCDRAQSRCTEQMPELTRPLGAGHPVACWFPEDPRRAGHGHLAGPLGPSGSARDGNDAAKARRAEVVGPDAPVSDDGDEPTAHEFTEG